MAKRPMQPKSRAQWEEAVDCAYVMLLIDSARHYGLVAGGPEVNIDRCLDLLRDGEKRGIIPQKERALAKLKANRTAPGSNWFV
jgi:hypothetical protein